MSCPTLLSAYVFRSGDQVFVTSRTMVGVQDVVTDMQAEVSLMTPYHSPYKIMVRSSLQIQRCPAKYKASLPELSRMKLQISPVLGPSLPGHVHDKSQHLRMFCHC